MNANDIIIDLKYEYSFIFKSSGWLIEMVLPLYPLR